jgi:hypothetical protein
LRFRAALSTWVAAAMVAAPPALAWGPEGHEVVALIAMRHLTPAASDEARRLLAVEGAPDIAAGASWADEHRHSHRGTGSWHYVDIPLDAAGYDAARDCPACACVITKIVEFAAELADRSVSDAKREVALKWIVHLVGDVHQPLHDEDHRDRGGNDVRVTWAGRTTNLHHVWDSDLVRVAGRNPEELTEQLDSNAPAIATDGAPADWANEAHALAPGAYSLPYSHRLGRRSRYVRRKVPVVELQLERAGLRLAALLNGTLGD